MYHPTAVRFVPLTSARRPEHRPQLVVRVAHVEDARVAGVERAERDVLRRQARRGRAPQFAIPKNESAVSFRQSASGIVPGFCTEFDGTA